MGDHDLHPRIPQERIQGSPVPKATFQKVSSQGGQAKQPGVGLERAQDLEAQVLQVAEPAEPGTTASLSRGF